MLESAYEVARAWLDEGKTRVAAATLVGVDGSAPLDPGATMLVGADGRIEGSVTGGCVEGALYEEAQALFAGGEPHVVTYGVSDEAAAGVGLMCGGTVHVFVHELPEASRPVLEAVSDRVRAGEPVAVARVLEGPQRGAIMAVFPDGCVGALGGTSLFDDAVARDARGFIEQGMSGTRRYGAGGEALGDEVAVHMHAFTTAPRLVVFGAIDFSAAVVTLGKQLGYRTTICDARAPFLKSGRFAVADELVVDWPDRYLATQSLTPRDVVLVFTHDSKFDVPAVQAALETPAGYIGALGSRRTHEDRLRRLREAGVADKALERLSSPCGLDIGGRTPAETAVSVLGEVIAHRHGRHGLPLADTGGSIHSSPSEEPVATA
jgi:xanthine dehydrogenase accessory factor